MDNCASDISNLKLKIVANGASEISDLKLKIVDSGASRDLMVHQFSHRTKGK